MENHSKVAYPGLIEAEKSEIFAVGREPKDLGIAEDFYSLSIPIHPKIPPWGGDENPPSS